MAEIGHYEEVDKSLMDKSAINPNYMTDNDEEKLGESIDRYGFLQTMLLYKQPDGRYLIIDGEHRWKKSSEPKLRSIVLEDKDVDIIQSNLKARGINPKDKYDVFKALLTSMNKFRGTFNPAELGKLIDSIDLPVEHKTLLLQMEKEEMNFYSQVQAVEEDKAQVHHKELDKPDFTTVKFKVKTSEGLGFVTLDFPGRKFYLDGVEKRLEDLAMTVNPKMDATLRIRYRDIQVTPQPQTDGTNPTEETTPE